MSPSRRFTRSSESLIAFSRSFNTRAHSETRFSSAPTFSRSALRASSSFARASSRFRFSLNFVADALTASRRIGEGFSLAIQVTANIWRNAERVCCTLYKASGKGITCENIRPATGLAKAAKRPTGETLPSTPQFRLYEPAPAVRPPGSASHPDRTDESGERDEPRHGSDIGDCDHRCGPRGCGRLVRDGAEACCSHAADHRSLHDRRGLGVRHVPARESCRWVGRHLGPPYRQH